MHHTPHSKPECLRSARIESKMRKTRKAINNNNKKEEKEEDDARMTKN